MPHESTEFSRPAITSSEPHVRRLRGRDEAFAQHAGATTGPGSQWIRLPGLFRYEEVANLVEGARTRELEDFVAFPVNDRGRASLYEIFAWISA